MNKKTIITALLAHVAVLIAFIILLGHGQESKKVVDTSKASKDSVEPMKQNDEVLTALLQFDISEKKIIFRKEVYVSAPGTCVSALRTCISAPETYVPRPKT